MASPPSIDFKFPPYHPFYPSPPPPPSHSFSPPPPPYGHPPPPPPPTHPNTPPPPHKLRPPPPHKLPPPPPHHPFIPPPPHVHPPPQPFPPPPSPDNHPTIIIIVFVSCGGILFLSLLACALFCLIKKRKKKTHETEVIHFDEHKHVTEAIVPGPHGGQIVMISVEDDVHIDEEIVKTEELGHGLHANAKSPPTDEGNSSSIIDLGTTKEGTSSNVDAGTTTSSDHDHQHHQQLESKP